MIRKLSKWTLQWLFTTLVVIGLGIAALGVRISQGPVPLHTLQPALQAQLANILGLPAGSVTIGNAALTYDSDTYSLVIRAEAMNATDNNGQQLVNIDEMEMGLSPLWLLVGRVEIRALTIIRPNITLKIDRDGQLGLALMNEQSAGVDLSGTKNPLRHLNKIRLEDAQLTIADERYHHTLRAQARVIDFHRRLLGFAGAIDVSVLRTNKDGETKALRVPMRMQGSAAFDLRVQKTLGTLRFENIALNDLGVMLAPFAVLPADFIGQLEQFHVPLNGALQAEFNIDRSLNAATLKLTGDKGDIFLPAYYDAPLPFKNIALNAHYEGKNNTIVLDDFLGVLDDPAGPIPFKLYSRAVLNKQDTPFMARLAIDHITIERLKHYWPRGVAANPNAWISENIAAGAISKAWVEISGAATQKTNDQPADFTITDIQGLLDTENLTLRYFGDYPPLVGLNGSAAFNANSFNITVASGRVDNITLDEKSSLTITGLDEDNQILDINATLRGPLNEILALLDRPPYKLASKFSLNPATAGGKVAARLRFNLPLIKTLPSESVKFSASANIVDGKLGNAVRGSDLTNANLQLSLDGDGLSLKGNGQLTDSALNFDWLESFVQTDAQSTMTFNGALNDGTRRAMQLPGADYFIGPMMVKGTLTKTKNNQGQLLIDADLNQTQLAISPLALTKPAGVPASMAIDLMLDDNAPRTLNNFALKGNDFDIAAKGAFTGSNPFPTSLSVNPLIVGKKTNAQLSIANGRATITGSQFDASGFLKPAPKKDNAPKQPDMLDGQNLAVSLKFDRVQLLNDQSLKNLKGSLFHTGDRWQKIDLAATLNDRGKFKFLWNTGQLSSTSDDAGALIAGLGLTDTMRGGDFVLSGGGDGVQTGGNVTIKNFKVVNAPLLARLLSLTSPGGLIDALQGSGIDFNKLSADFTHNDNEIVVYEGRTSGASLGLTFNGRINRTADTLDLQGTIVPLYALNSVLGNIPLLGDLLTGGGKGEGIFAATYTITGKTDAAEVSVNPLSTFAPGFLRRLLFQNDAPERPQNTDEPVANPPQ